MNSPYAVRKSAPVKFTGYVLRYQYAANGKNISPDGAGFVSFGDLIQIIYKYFSILTI